jgi:hypothetical protein
LKAGDPYFLKVGFLWGCLDDYAQGSNIPGGVNSSLIGIIYYNWPIISKNIPSNVFIPILIGKNNIFSRS